MRKAKEKIACLIAVTSLLTSCGAKTVSESSEAETTLSKSTAETTSEDSTSSEDAESLQDEQEKKEYSNEGAGIIAGSLGRIKAENEDMKSFKAVISVNGKYTPLVSTADASEKNGDIKPTGEGLGAVTDFEADYVAEFSENGVHLKGTAFINDKTETLEAYYTPSSENTVIYYRCSRNGGWNTYSNCNKFVVPNMIDDLRDNADVHFVNAQAGKNGGGYVVSTKLTSERLEYVNSAVFESVFFTDLYDRTFGGSTEYTVSEDGCLVNLTAKLSSEQLEATVSADLYDYGCDLDVSAPSDVLADAETLDFKNNGFKLWKGE